jgi:ATP-binding cassette subfamily F protein uup
MTSALISAQNLTRTFGVKPLFTDLTMVIGEGERLALIGPNGAGKSTLMKLLTGMEDPDGGEIAVRRGLRMELVPQQPRFSDGATIEQVLIAAAQQGPGYEYEQEARIELLKEELKFADVTQLVSSLSGGWRKRLALGVALVKEPDLLFLDEPTNHLDIEGILWLEEYLSRSKAALCFVSHDRYFIEKLASRVIEIDRRYPRGTFTIEGTYSDFVLARDDFFAQMDRTQRTMAAPRRKSAYYKIKTPQCRGT